MGKLGEQWCVEIRAEGEVEWIPIVWTESDVAENETHSGLYKTKGEAQYYVDRLKWAENPLNEYGIIARRVFARAAIWQG